MRRSIPLAFLLLTAATASAQIPRNTSGVEVPMQVFENGLYPSAFALVEVQFGRYKANLLLDTGASIHVLSSALAASIDMTPGGTLQALGASESRPATHVRLPTMSVGDVEFQDQHAMLLSNLGIFDRFRTQHGVHVDGLLGAPAFKIGPVTLDFEAGVMVFHDPQSFEPPEHSTRLVLKTLHGIPVLEASLGPNDPANFLIDTGHSNPLLIHGPYAKGNGLLRYKGDLLRYGMDGVFGRTEAYMGLLPMVRLGETEVSDLPATVVSDEGHKGLAQNTESAGNIGLALLARFRITFDFATGSLYLEPRESATAMPTDFGISLTRRRNRVVIEEVGRDSPAEVAGLRPRDRIIAIDGRPCPRTVTETIRLLRDSDGLRMMVKRQRRRSFTVELEKQPYLPYVVPAGG